MVHLFDQWCLNDEILNFSFVVFLFCSPDTSKVCSDDPSFDCIRTSGFYNLCADVKHARTVCKKFCGLCNIGKWYPDMACNTRKGTLGRLRKVSFQISLRFMYLFCLQQVYCSTKSNGVVKCRLGLACADSASWSETTLYANVRKSLFWVLQAICRGNLFLSLAELITLRFMDMIIYTLYLFMLICKKVKTNTICI